MEFGEMKRNTSNWINFCILLSRAGLSASAELSCSIVSRVKLEQEVSRLSACFAK